jgi:hypothetical protein
MLKINFKSFLAVLLFCIGSIFNGYTQDIQKNIPFKDNYSYDRIIPVKDAGFIVVFGSKQLGDAFDYYDTNFNPIKTLIPKGWKKAKDENFYPEYFVANENTILYVQNEQDKRMFYINAINQAGVSASATIAYKEEGTDIVGLFCLNNKFILITRNKDSKGLVKYFLYKIDENNLATAAYKVLDLKQDKYESSFYTNGKEESKIRTLWKVGGALDNKLILIKSYIKSEGGKDSVKIESCEVDVEGMVSNKYKYIPFVKPVEELYQLTNIESIFDPETKEFYLIGYLGDGKAVAQKGFFISKYNYKSTLVYSKFYTNRSILSELSLAFMMDAPAAGTRKRYVFDPFNHAVYPEIIYGSDNGDVYNLVGIDKAGTIFEIGRGKIENESIDDFQNTLTTNLSVTFRSYLTVVYKDEKTDGYNATRKKNNVDYMDIITYKEGGELKKDQTKFRDYWSSNSDFYYLFETGIKTGIKIMKIKRK